MTMATRRCPYCAEEIQADAVKCKHCGTWLEGAGPGVEATPGAYPDAPPPIASKRLTRSTTDKMMAGLCGGLARYLGMDSTLLRVIVALVTILTGIVPGIVIYIVVALIVPRDDSPRATGY